MSPTQIIYSIGVRFAAGGIGDIAYFGASSLYKHGMLSRLLCGSYRKTEIPDEYIREMGLISRGLRRLALHDRGGYRVSSLHNKLYDRWVRWQLEPCEIFLSWNGFGLAALQQASAGGAATVVYRASSHPREQARQMREEHARWGIPYERPAADVELAVAEMEEADYILIPSDYVRQTCLQEGIEPERFIQIPFGVDTDRYQPAHIAADEKPFRVLFLGQIGFRKGVPYLLQAWEKLGWKDAELWLVGRVQAEFESWLRPYRRLPGLVLPGHVSDPAQLLQQSHLFVFPTIEEGSALVVYEAMASALPVITTPNAGSLIQSGRDGILVPIRDAAQLAEQMTQLRANKQRRHELGQSARRRIEPYTWARYGDSLATELGKRVADHA